MLPHFKLFQNLFADFIKGLTGFWANFFTFRNVDDFVFTREVLRALEALAPLQDAEMLWSPVDTALVPVLPFALEVGGQRLSMFAVVATFGTAQDITADELERLRAQASRASAAAAEAAAERDALAARLLQAADASDEQARSHAAEVSALQRALEEAKEVAARLPRARQLLTGRNAERSRLREDRERRRRRRTKPSPSSTAAARAGGGGGGGVGGGNGGGTGDYFMQERRDDFNQGWR